MLVVMLGCIDNDIVMFLWVLCFFGFDGSRVQYLYGCDR